MQLSLYPYQLKFKYPFRIAHGMRTHTDVVYVKLEHEGKIAWGEAALPPYLSEMQQTVIDFLTHFAKTVSADSPDEWMEKLRAEQNNLSAKAALDIALWNLKSQLRGKSIGQLLGIASKNKAVETYTIGVSSLDEMKTKVKEAEGFGFEMFKLKLDGVHDKEMVESFRKLSNKPFAADVNQGWKNVEEAAQKISWLKAAGCPFVEQPLPKNDLKAMAQLKETSELPLYADESCQRLNDIEKMTDCFHGVNIKLMKCGGITEAFEMVKKARELGMKILIGCMSESSIGCNAAAHLTPLANYADLDGPYLVANDPFIHHMDFTHP